MSKKDDKKADEPKMKMDTEANIQNRNNTANDNRIQRILDRLAEEAKRSQ